MSKSILYARSVPINDKISVVVPTIGQILEDESKYYGLVTAMVATPTDLMVQLDDAGINYAEVDDFDLFIIMFDDLRKRDTSLLFGDLKLDGFQIAVNDEDGSAALVDTENDIVIDRSVYMKMCQTIREINHLDKNEKKPGNEEARKYLIERARKKQRRAMRKPWKSQLEDLIIAMVNTEQYKYNYETTLDLTIYQFNKSVTQVINKINYDNTMIGVYAGTVDTKTISQDKLNWLTSN